jgi:hypothetical protein
MNPLRAAVPRRARLLAAAGLVAAALGAQAQPQAMRPETTRAEAEWLEGVHSALGHRDCPRAVARLNDGLERRFPDAYVMAGAMFEQGLCVKAQWERASTMYQRALAAGHRGGQYRLVAGMAERDPAVALWWSQEGSALQLPSECRVAAEAHRDAEAYAAALRAWPSGRLGICSFIAGVSASVFGEVEYPGDTRGRQIDGTVEMHILPGAGRIEWQGMDLKLSEAWVAQLPAARAGRLDAQAREAVRAYLDGIAQRALRRYPIPAQAGADLRLVVRLAFFSR